MKPTTNLFVTYSFRLTVIPGKGCGIFKPLRPLKADDLDKITSPLDAECGTIREEVWVLFFVSIWYCNAVFCLKDEVLVKTITEKVDELKCKEDSGACQNAKSGYHKDIDLPISLEHFYSSLIDSIFIKGGGDCSSTTVTIIKGKNDVPDNPLSLQCALIDSTLVKQLRCVIVLIVEEG